MTPEVCMKLTATQQFVDKQGVTHQTGESFETSNDQDAQDYIRKGQAKEQDKHQGAGEPARNR